MSLTYLGSLSVGAAVPSVNLAVLASLPNLEAQLAGLLAAQVDITAHPPTIAASLSTAAAIVASLQAQILLGLEVPTATIQLAAIASAIASISGQIAALVSFQVALGPAGVHAYAYNGPADGLGPALTGELALGLPGGAPTDPSFALILDTSSAPAWAAMSVVLKTS